MVNIASISSIELKNRRQELQRRRRIEFLQAIWRLLIVSAMAGGLLWVVTLPNWVIRQGSQIEIEGDQFLSKDEIRALIPLSYPQSILQLQTQQLIQQLKSTAPIAEARVTRQLLPPRLTIQVKERPPVAIALSPKKAATQTNSQTVEVGFLDEQGTLVPKSFYSREDKDFELPNLKVTGFREQHRPYWPELYQLITHSTVQIFAVDLQDPRNLILKTELGNVYFGPSTSQLPEQLALLAQMRELPTHINASQIVYIDLTNPSSPAIKLSQE
ncbi:MAG: cell division protein FtsQ/DivIB [Xenococcaceae cyanobacterium]